jgi:ABC-type antimicrobial peptide transport system permease subunit
LAALSLTLTRVSMMNFQTWQEISFSFAATPGIMLTALIAGTGMGIIGGFLPALKAAGTSPIEAMRG